MFTRLKDRIDEEIEKDGLLHHYKLMLFFLFNRFENSNRFEGSMYFKLRCYFARRLIVLLRRFMGNNWKDKTLLDIGGATGDFCHYISKKTGASCVNLDADRSKIFRAYFQPSILGDGLNLNFADNAFDIVVSRGVIEHIPTEKHRQFIHECYRVLKTKGIGYLTSSSWFAPWAGHQLAPFHLFPIKFACFLANFFYGKQYRYSSYADAGIFYLSFQGVKKMLLESGFKIEYIEDPITRLNFFTKVPILREVLVQHMAFVVSKPERS